ncbi:MAG: YdcF family protein [Candidatus Omnitrophica bacterium]|nr:YdcF family protein [Candidatus Omnitrophota bacterium]
MDISDLLKPLVTPLMLILIISLSGIIMLGKFRKISFCARAGWYCGVISWVIAVLLSFNPVANILVQSLETQFKPVQEEQLKKIDAVVILGGGLLPSGGLRKYPEANGTTYARVFQGVAVFKQSGAQVLVVSGSSLEPEKGTEADVMREIAVSLGVPSADILMEAKSRTTMENANETSRMLSPAVYDHIGLVTSAMHMKRSFKTFQKVFPPGSVIPVPVNYMSSPVKLTYRMFIPSVDALCLSTEAIHEWIGLMWYFLRYGV